MTMLILSVDSTATPASVALYDDRLIAEYYIHTKLTHSQTLVSMIESVLTVTGVKIEDIDRYAVNNGPGSFTGVRIGVAAVKGMAYAQDKPCVAVSTLESIAHQFPYFDGIICPCMDARRQQVYNAIFSVSGERIERLCDDRAIAIPLLLEELSTYSGRVILTGDGAALVDAMAPERGYILAPEHLRYQRAASTAMLAASREPVNAASLMPGYLRLSQAERERNEKLTKE